MREAAWAQQRQILAHVRHGRGGRRAQYGLVQLSPRAGRDTGDAPCRGGRLGRIFHDRAKFLQDWTISKEVPQGGAGLRRLDLDVAGSGVSGDLLAHCIDTSMRLNGRIDTVTATTETFVKEMHNLTGRSKGLASMTRAPSTRASQTARSRPSRRRAMRAGTRRPTRSRSTASTLRFPGICTICIACSISTTRVKAACVAGVRYMSATVIILR